MDPLQRALIEGCPTGEGSLLFFVSNADQNGYEICPSHLFIISMPEMLAQFFSGKRAGKQILDIIFVGWKRWKYNASAVAV